MLKVRDILLPSHDFRLKNEDTNSEDFTSLVESIKANGVIEPLIVDQDRKLLAGSRRLRASTLAGLKEVPAVIKNVSDLDGQIITVSENLHRKDLSVIEKKEALTKLYHSAGYDKFVAMRYLMRINEGPAKRGDAIVVPEQFRELTKKIALSTRRQWELLRLSTIEQEVVDYAEEKKLSGNKIYMLTRGEVREKPIEEQKEIIDEIASVNEKEARQVVNSKITQDEEQPTQEQNEITSTDEDEISENAKSTPSQPVTFDGGLVTFNINNMVLPYEYANVVRMAQIDLGYLITQLLIEKIETDIKVSRLLSKEQKQELLSKNLGCVVAGVCKFGD